MTEKTHAGQVIKTIQDKEQTLEELKNEFKETTFEDCQGNSYNIEELVQFLLTKGAIEEKENKFYFKGCPSDGCN